MFGLNSAREAKGSLEMARGKVSATTTTAKLFQSLSLDNNVLIMLIYIG
ncbi:hypothetical protein Gotur_020712 [Gossypium turneri]